MLHQRISTGFNKTGPESTKQMIVWPSFLQDKFQGRVISNRLDFFWPAKSPDLNPLDFYFWGVAEARVQKEKPKTIMELKSVVENFVAEISKEVLWSVADNFIKRAKMCHENDGGHFEYLM